MSRARLWLTNGNSIIVQNFEDGQESAGTFVPVMMELKGSATKRVRVRMAHVSVVEPLDEN